MMTDFVSTVPVPYVDQFGLHVPAFEDVLAALKNDIRGIYGQDIYLENDSQDGQLLGIQARGFSDSFAVATQVYEAFSPISAQGAGLSSVVKVNDIKRLVPSFSTVDLTITGVAGTVVVGGKARDKSGNLWDLPPTVTIPLVGFVVVSAVCETLGAVEAGVGEVDEIATITKNWQSVVNASAAAPGAPVESDPSLRVRQSRSTMLAATGVLDGMQGAILALPGVARVRGYENDTNSPDANGIPGHSIAMVVDGGDAAAIAGTIAQRKLSSGTYGSTSQIVVTGVAQIPRVVNFFRPTEPPITYALSVKALRGFTTDTQAQIAQAISDWTNALGIGDGDIGSIDRGRVYGPALLTGTAAAGTFTILGIQMARDGNVPGATAVPIAFNEAPTCSPSNVTFTVTT